MIYKEINMPPKVKVTKSEIIKTAVELIRAKGENALNARNIAKALNCSTQPIFSNFKAMDELQSEVLKLAYELYLGFLKSEAQSGKYPQYKSFGMAYIRFAKQESNLFKLLFMRDRRGETLSVSVDFEQSVNLIMSSNSTTREIAERIHFESWVFVHGIATMIATSFLTLDWDAISDMLTDVYQGLKAKHLQ